MATTVKSRNGIVIAVTLFIAMLLMLVPLPEAARYFRPEWVLMTLIYWAMALPQRVSIGVGWLTGLLTDVMMGMTLGIMAFSYALAVYLIARLHLQLRQHPLWQQTLTIFLVLMLVHLVVILAVGPNLHWIIWMPVLTSTCIWPLMYIVLRNIRRTFQVS